MVQALNVQFNDLYQSDIYRPSNAFNLFKSNGRQLLLKFSIQPGLQYFYANVISNASLASCGTDFCATAPFSGDFHLFRLATWLLAFRIDADLSAVDSQTLV